MRYFDMLALALLLTSPLHAAEGVYVNPVLSGDHSDPDAVRVGDDFYLVSSSFSNVPGLPVLHSRDLVHWKIIGHALPRLEPDAHYAVPRHGGGVWAPAIRYHAGRFVIYYPDPDRGIFMVSAKMPEGPWSRPVLVDDSHGAIDPCPFWDDDGSGWLVHAWARSRAGISNRIVLKRLNTEGSKTVGEGVTVFDGETAPPVATSNGVLHWLTTEGPKLYKRNGWYYIFAPSGSVQGGWQGVLRARHIAGPYEARNVLDQGATEVNGPHQGAWVTTAAGEDWFLHFRDNGTYGRQVWLEPMTWKNDWPVIGRPVAGTDRGEPVLTWRLPQTAPSTSDPVGDEFDGRLSSAWQWNANPQDGWSSLRDRPGAVRLRAVPTPDNLWNAANILTYKLPAASFTATAKLTFVPVRDGERSGLMLYGKSYAWLGLMRDGDRTRLVSVRRLAADVGGEESLVAVLDNPPDTVYLRLTVEPVSVSVPPPDFKPYWPSMLKTRNALIRFSYSLDNVSFVPVGEPFLATPGVWVGGQIGLFAAASRDAPPEAMSGWADYDWFRIGR